MAFTTPATFSVGQIVNASDMNLITANIAYLHGDTGTTAFAAGITTTGSVVATLGGNSQNIINALSGNASLLAGMGVGRTAQEVQMAVPAVAGQFFAGAAVGDMILRNLAGAKIMLGIGAQPLLTLRAGAIGTSGMDFSTVAAVTTVQTIFPAGTIARAALLLILDRNNTSGLNTLSTLSAIGTLGTTLPTYSSGGDTMTVIITAGGGVTVARTAGTAGTHDVMMLALYF